ncbi:hypothetical protein OG410_01630 [Streptomyces sp. NBC_00659]|uniref:hypothetical protein n=1 Tax=Streptomyces sp. NBC_00659 TaxID=2903669 RepID=UPI002E3179EA|nr:hypothetical protein [Streptomyces sp. NBC_00659]
MTVARILRPTLAAALLASATACGASSGPDTSSGATAGPTAVKTHGTANPQPVSAAMPDVIGGNAGRAFEQMGSELDMTFKDASGRGRSVDDPAEWKICGSQPGPNQQITDFPVVFEVMEVSESCQDATPN